jgi:hypothetical protein
MESFSVAALVLVVGYLTYIFNVKFNPSYRDSETKSFGIFTLTAMTVATIGFLVAFLKWNAVVVIACVFQVLTLAVGWFLLKDRKAEMTSVADRLWIKAKDITSEVNAKAKTFRPSPANPE